MAKIRDLGMNFIPEDGLLAAIKKPCPAHSACAHSHCPPQGSTGAPGGNCPSPKSAKAPSKKKSALGPEAVEQLHAQLRQRIANVTD